MHIMDKGMYGHAAPGAMVCFNDSSTTIAPNSLSDKDWLLTLVFELVLAITAPKFLWDQYCKRVRITYSS